MSDSSVLAWLALTKFLDSSKAWVFLLLRNGKTKNASYRGIECLVIFIVSILITVNKKKARFSESVGSSSPWWIILY